MQTIARYTAIVSLSPFALAGMALDALIFGPARTRKRRRFYRQWRPRLVMTHCPHCRTQLAVV